MSDLEKRARELAGTYGTNEYRERLAARILSALRAVEREALEKVRQLAWEHTADETVAAINEMLQQESRNG